MIQVDLLHSANLRPFNTFGVAARARWLAHARSIDGLLAALELAQREDVRVEVFGGGSNLLIVDDLEAVVVLPQLRGVTWLGNHNGRVHVSAAAGENWHDFVALTIAHEAFGLENLALIPGHVGAAPIQNIGAYGVELDRFVVAVDAYDRQREQFCRIDRASCEFSYRDSLFKHDPNRYLITAVEFALHTEADLHLNYAGVREQLSASGINVPTPKAVFDAICAIRRRKLPDPAEIGNAGSFFKNPLVDTHLASVLQAAYPTLPIYSAAQGKSKLAAGWLIEYCGWKGARVLDAGVHQQNALVLVNYGKATGRELLAIAQHIQADVSNQFGVQLEIEPRIVGV